MSKNNEIKNLKEKLFSKKENGGKVLSDEIIKNVEKFSVGYKEFLNLGKTERECVNYTLEKAKKLGFKAFDRTKKYKHGDKIYLINRNSAIILGVIGSEPLENGINFAISHIDAPRIDLKPNPIIEDKELVIFKTHYYGGIKKYQWTTVPLALHGRIVKDDGTYLDISIGENDEEPKFCVTDLLPHLAKEQMSKKLSEVITGEDLNVLIGSLPFKGGEDSQLVKLNILKILNDKYGIVEGDFISADLHLVPATKACDIGFDKSLVGGYGQDDRSCSYTCIESIFEIEKPTKTCVAALMDKEEVGSDGNTGTKSAFFKNFVADLAATKNIKKRHIFEKSRCLSADVNAAFDPTYATAYEAANSCYVNRGVVLTKYTGGGGKSGTSDASAEFTGEIRNILNENDILWQCSELGRVDLGGGGTIAKYIANLNIDVIDIGLPVLSMHAPFEISSKIDLYMTYRAIKAFFYS